MTDLSKYTSFHVGGPARKILQVSTQEEIIAAIEEAGDSPILILGGGTNVLVSDSGFEGTVIRISNNSVQAEVDVLFSYFMAFNREAMTQVGGFNPRAVYYRNADIEFSLKIRQAGGKLLQMDLPLTQGRHHGYHDADPDYRDAQSKKTFDRILEKYRGKEAILSPRR
jgi:hypothetical protein